MPGFFEVPAWAGEQNPAGLLDEPHLTTLQKLIVDPRYAEQGFRQVQNYVGESLGDRVHYVCPPPALVKTLVAGLRSFLQRSQGLPAPIRAAGVSFGFIYVHPFEDRNVRVHRLPLHESLAHDHYPGSGVVLPLSAAMLRKAADTCLPSTEVGVR